ncbi:hypothetical protein U0070_002038 [Myodes glareolus]|uniref:E3 ubiquitin-protein ligase NRDP1 domain-containing protein n=1 Tax=Myodes glareolus TaxID=447135 RepID=A0AAW0HSH5_MYOGA
MPRSVKNQNLKQTVNFVYLGGSLSSKGGSVSDVKKWIEQRGLRSRHQERILPLTWFVYNVKSGVGDTVDSSNFATRSQESLDELPNHNCIKYLRSLVQQQQTCVAGLKGASAEHKRRLAEQKRDIQLLKKPDAVLRAVSKHSLVESGCLASTVHAMVGNAHKRSWSPGSGRTRDKTMNHGYCKNNVSKNIPS